MPMTATPDFNSHRRTALKVLPALALAAAVLQGCSGDSSAVESSAPSEATPIAVTARTAAYESVPAVVRASGSVEPLRQVSPGTKILGRIDRVAVSEGDRVDAGALLALLEKRDLDAAVRQAEAAVKMAEAQLANALAQHDRIQSLHGRGSVTDKSLEDATSGLRVAEAGVAQAQANLDAARVMLGYAEVRSPIAGWIVAKRVEAGDMATPGTPLFTVEDLSRVKVAVQVPEQDVAGLAAGDPARVEVLNRELTATIDHIVPSGDPASRTFTVKLILPNDGTLKSGMFARVVFVKNEPAGGERRVLRVEESALVLRGQLEGLYVVDGGTPPEQARLRWISTGRHQDGRVEVLSGLADGERYVVEPPLALSDGAPVTVR